MAFKGDLRNISLFDVLQTLHQNQQTGVLVLQHGDITKKIFVGPEGVRIFFTRSFRPLRLGEIFVRRGLLTSQDVEILLLEQKREYRPMGQILVESGKVPEEEVAKILRYHAEDQIFEIFGWEEGTFAFYDGRESGASSTPLSEVLMDPAGLCLEAARRLDEMERLRQAIPSDNDFFVQAEGVEPDREQSSKEIRVLFETLAEPNRVEDLRDLVGLSHFETLHSLDQLITAGLARPLDVEELVAASRLAHERGNDDRAAHLLEAAHRSAPRDRALLEECVATLQRLRETRRLGTLLEELGALCLEAGDTTEAVEHLEHAQRCDGASTRILQLLSEAFADLGDTERAAELALKLARTKAEGGNLDGALAACRRGLEIAPKSVALRFFLGQTLVRAGNPEEAEGGIRALIDETFASRRALHSEKAVDLLTSCYRLLLRINPEDEDAHKGLRDLDRRIVSGMRRRRVLLRGGIAAAVLALVSVVGLTLAGPSAEGYLEKIREASGEGRLADARRLVDKLLQEYPDSEEAPEAIRLRKQFDTTNDPALQARRRRETKLRADIADRREELTAALSDRPYVDALDLAIPFLKRLDRKEYSFLRKDATTHVQFSLMAFLDRVRRNLKADRRQVVTAEHELQQFSVDRDAAKLLELENRLARIRGRAWPDVLPEVIRRLDGIAAMRSMSGAKRAISEFRREASGAVARFGALDDLYFAVKRERYRTEIIQAVALAEREGQEHLRLCEFDRARELFSDAYEKANEVTDLEPRPYFIKLLDWIEQRNILRDMKQQRDRIDSVVETLDEVSRRIGKGQADVAYRLLRDLVSRNRLIEFELRYRMPYKVESTPAGAEVYVDGKLSGHTPCAIELRISGARRCKVRIHRDGFRDEEQALLSTDEKLDGTLFVALAKRPAWDREVGGVIEAPPVIHGGRLLLATSNASLIALDLKDGKQAWEASTHGLDRIRAAPVVAGDFVYVVTVSGRLFRVRLRDGAMPGEGLQLPGAVEQDGAFDGKTLYLAARGPRLIAIRDGRVIYARPLAFAASTNLVFHAGRIYIGTADRGTILVHDAITGGEIDRLQAPSGTSIFGGLAIQGDLLLAGAEDGFLYAFDTRTKKPAWAFRTAGPITAPPAEDRTLAYLPTREGYVRAIDALGRSTVNYEVGNAVDRTPALEDGFLYAIASDHVTAFDTISRKTWWEHRFDSEQTVHVAAGGGYVVVVTAKPWVYAFPRDRR